MPLWIWGSPVKPEAARRMVAMLLVAGTSECRSAAAAIDRSIDDEVGLVDLDEAQRDALLHVLEDDGRDEQVAELRRMLSQDHKRRWGSA